MEVSKLADTLIVEGMRLSNDLPAELTIEEWFSIYDEIGLELEGRKSQRVEELAKALATKTAIRNNASG